MAEVFYIVDLRPEWRRKRYITFWRPEDSGYAFPLPWAGKYTEAEVLAGGSYYNTGEGRRLIRFPVRCSVVDKLGTPPLPGDIDGDVGPVVLAAHRDWLRRHRLRLPASRKDPSHD